MLFCLCQWTKITAFSFFFILKFLHRFARLIWHVIIGVVVAGSQCPQIFPNISPEMAFVSYFEGAGCKCLCNLKWTICTETTRFLLDNGAPTGLPFNLFLFRISWILHKWINSWKFCWRLRAIDRIWLEQNKNLTSDVTAWQEEMFLSRTLNKD